MPAEQNASQPALLADSDLELRPFARRMAEECPDLWARFLRACRRERAAEEGITPAEFVSRCTQAARRTAA